MQPDGITVNSVCPGMVNTNILRNAPLFMKIILNSISFFMKSPLQGAQTILYCSMSSDVDKITGRYFSNCEDVTETETHPLTKDIQKSSKLWNETKKLVAIN